MNEFQPGDKVVELGAMVRSVTIAAGAISAALLLILARQNGGHCVVGFLGGAVTGFMTGLFLSRLLYTDGNGNVRVVQAAPENLPVTLRAALTGAGCQTVVVLVCLGCLGKIVSWPAAASTALGVNLLVAFAVARLSLQ